jgi:anaerobic selenocysteine-containing dehydrogenase
MKHYYAAGDTMPTMRDSNFPIPVTGSVNVIGACPHDCPDTCSLVTSLQDGIATKIHGNPVHPHTDGVLCTKVSRYTERTYHPERILHPLKRSGPKGSGQFERVSWDAALTDIAGRLTAIAARGPEAAQAILPYSYAGTMGLVQSESMAARFFHQLCASLLNRTICATAGGEGLVQTLGGKVGMRVEFFAESRLIIIWGSNSIASNLHFWRYAQVAKRNGAKLICIDPRKSETAEKCHEHIALLPGTDAALALALMHELITNNWLDHDYIAQYTLGCAARTGAAMATRARGIRVRHCGGADHLAGTRLWRLPAARRARCHSHELWLATRQRWRQRGARHCLPARIDWRVAAPRGGRIAVQFRPVSGG